MSQSALLALEDGSLFHGISVGAPVRRCGEAVFNTAMTGYEEILSDPSYSGQLVCLTAAHIGNTGMTLADLESAGSHCAGLIIRNLSLHSSSWRSRLELPTWLEQAGLPAIAGVDTRRLTRLLSSHGSQRACLVCDGNLDPARAVDEARRSPSMEGLNLASAAGTPLALQWSTGSGSPQGTASTSDGGGLRVVVLDLGAKQHMLRRLVDRGCSLVVVPPSTPADTILALEPDGVLLSNGPGDPAACHQEIATVRQLLDLRLPLFGICLGHQLLALAAGARTRKLAFGHHGANHPVRDEATGEVWITSQNHGFCVDEEGLPDTLQVTQRSLFDGSIQGIRCTSQPAFGFQGHPEACPGPRDADRLFDRFVVAMSEFRRARHGQSTAQGRA
ncbi:MAG: glutamine-hydrolyzing carbamoyl-phosphate synthase small subunit [Candidatus Cloacimonetes bacterium]|nr:glutamine-hydrolyzing carbamoyl-phosphate synthase small subunit [Candidatus Cloacimonadota bacterium]